MDPIQHLLKISLGCLCIFAHEQPGQAHGLGGLPLTGHTQTPVAGSQQSNNLASATHSHPFVTGHSTASGQSYLGVGHFHNSGNAAASLPVTPTLYKPHPIVIPATISGHNQVSSLINTHPWKDAAADRSPTLSGNSSVVVAQTTVSGVQTSRSANGNSGTNSPSSATANNGTSGTSTTSGSGASLGSTSQPTSKTAASGSSATNSSTTSSGSSSTSSNSSTTSSGSSSTSSNSSTTSSGSSSTSSNSSATSSGSPSTASSSGSSNNLPGAIKTTGTVTLNLSSQNDSVSATNNSPVQIVIGGTMNAQGAISGGNLITIKPGQLITPAEAVAVDQLAAGGHQTLLISSQGIADGGILSLQAGSVASVSNLIVPSHVTVDTIGFTSSTPLQVTGSAQVGGSIIALAQSSNSAAVLDFGNLTVASGGSITDIMPKTMPLVSGLLSANGITLNVSNSFVNQGTVTSGTSLTLNAGGSLVNQTLGSGPQALISAPTVSLVSHSGTINNSGLITATAGNLSIGAPASLTVTNNSGTLSVPSGQINFRDPTFSGSGNLTVTGGNISAATVNAYSGTGGIDVNVNTLNGLVNATATAANFTASTSNLDLGVMNLTGDPSFYNTTGNVTINAPLAFAGAPVAIVAHGDITFGAAATSISTSGATGGNILIAAGASFTSTGVPANSNDTASTLTIVSGVPGGGAILGSSLTSITSSSTGGGAGGNINIVAFGGINNTAGTITLGNAAITAAGNGGANGNVNIIGGSQTAANAIQLGAVSTTGGTSGTGNISIAAATVVTNGPVTVSPGGNITSGSFTAGAGGASSVSTGAITANGANITLTAGSVATPANFEVTGAITDTRSAAGTGGLVTINVASSTAFTIGAASANGVSGNILVNNGAAGAGGTLDITNSGNGGVSLAVGAVLNIGSTNGNGGTLSLNSGTGALALQGGTINASGTGAAGAGGNVALQGSNITFAGGPLILNASGAGTANGGVVSVTATAAGSAFALGNAAGQIEIETNSGITGGNAGQVTVSAGGNLTVNSATGLLSAPLGAAGNGANITLTAGTAGAGNLSIAGNLSVNGAAGGGAGGTISLTSNSATAFTIANTAQINGLDGTVTANAGGVAGNLSGTIIVNNLGSGGLSLAVPANVTADGSAKGGPGGSITLNAGTGTLALGAGVINADAIGPGTYNGGTINLNGAAVTVSAAGTLTTAANGAGGGNGGMVNITAAGGNIPLGIANGSIIISATGGATGSATGNGGTVTVNSTNGNVTVSNPAALAVGPLGTNGTGATINLSAGSAGAGNLFVNGNLAANGVGTGAAGNITLVSNSAAAFTIGAGAATNGVDGTITTQPGATAGLGAAAGGLSVTNLGTGGVTLLAVGDVNAPAPAGGGNGGNITLAAPAGTLTLPTGTISVMGAGNGSGGKVSLSGKTLNATLPFSVDANGAGTGNGGTISLVTQDPAALNINAAALSFSAQGGPTSGNGGSVTVSNGGNLTANPTAIKVNPQAGTGNGGTINLTAGNNGAGDLLVTGPINVNGLGTGNGGIVTLNANSAAGDPFLVATATDNGVQGNITANSGPGGGSGGSISLNNNGASGVSLSSTAVLSLSAVNGNGGNLSITSANGPVTIPPGTFNVSAQGAGNFNGGNVTIKGQTIAVTPAPGYLSIVSNGLGSGNAGDVNTEATGAGSTLGIGTANGDIDIQGNGGPTAGAPSNVVVKTGGDLTVDPASLVLNPGANGNGPSLTLAAGTSGTGNLLVNGNINVSGVGSGNGGSVVLSSASATPFSVNPGVATTNGVEGTITANGGPTGGNGGSVTIDALGTTGVNGGIAVTHATDISFTPITSGAGGTLVLSATNPGGTDGPISLPGGNYNGNAVGPGSFAGGNIALQGSAVNVNGGPLNLTANATGAANGGTITVTTTSGTGNIAVGAGVNDLNISATGGSTGSAAGNGGTVALSAGGNLTVNAANLVVNPQGTNGNGGNISLADATGTTAGTMQITGSLSADGAGTGNGGNIQIAYKDATNAFIVGTAPAAGTSGISGNITADAPGTGSGGNITISNTAPNAPLTINLSTATAAITASAATASTTNLAPLGNLNFNEPGQAVSVTGPGTTGGFVNATGSTVDIDPQATGTTVYVGTIAATAGNARISSPAGTVDVPLGNTASATGNIAVNTQTLLIGGAITTSGSNASINVSSSGNLLVSGDGLLQVSGAGANQISVQAAAGSTLTLDEAPVYAVGAAGNVSFLAQGAGGQIVLTPGSNQNIRDGNPATIDTTSLVMNDGSAFTARGATVFSVFSDSNLPLTITAPTNGSSAIETTGTTGAINIYTQTAGEPITFQGSAGGPATLNLLGGPVTTTESNAATTVNAGITVQSDHNITINANSGSFINNGTVTSSAAAAQIAVQSNAALTVGGTGTVSATGGGAANITIGASVGTTTGNALDFTGSQTFDAGTGAGATVTFSSPNCPSPTDMGSITLSPGVTETVASGVPLTVVTPTLTFGAASAIADTAKTGVGINTVTGGNCSLTVYAPSGSSSTMSTLGGSLNFAPGPVGGPVPNTYSITFDQTTPSSTATLNLQGGPVNTTTNGGTQTVTTGTTVLANNNVTMNVNNGTLVANGTIHSTKATGAAGLINVLSTGTLGLQGIGNVTVDPTIAGAGGTINVNSSGAMTVQNGTFTANANTNGAGGTITVQGSTIAVNGGSTLNLIANAAGAGNGGTLTMKTTGATGDIAVGAAVAGGVVLQAEGGTTSGNGGSVTISAGRALTLAGAASGDINVSPQSLTGNGGNVTLIASTAAAGAMTLNPLINANALTGGTGNGGTITATDNSTKLLQVPSGVFSANSGTAGGIGGQINVTNTGTGGIEFQGNVSATGYANTSPAKGNSGQIVVNAGGNVLFDGGQLNAAGVTGNSSGGNVSVTAGTISQANNSAETFNASGSGTGSGGTVSLTTTGATGDIVLGNTVNGTTFQLSATGGSGGSAAGNGGTVTVSAGRALSLQTGGSINVSPQGTNGTGGSVTLKASTAAAGALTLGVPINANGAGVGNGGKISVTDNSSFQIAVPPNIFSANSGTTGYGGQISITNTGGAGLNGGIDVQGSLSTQGANNTAANSGTITINAGGATPGPVTLDGGQLNANGNGAAAGTSNGGTVAVTGSTVTLTGASDTLTANASGSGNGGSVSVTTLSATGDITVGAGGTGLLLTATGGTGGGTPSSAGNGGTVTLSAGRNLAVPAGAAISVSPLGTNGSGGSVLLSAGSVAAAGTVEVNEGIQADGVGSGNGGKISISYNDPTGAAIVVGNNPGSGSYVNGAINADADQTAGGTGNGGTVTIQNSAAAELSVALTGANITANQSVTGALGNLNFPTSTTTPQTVLVTGNGNLTGLVNSNGSVVTINPTPATATTLTAGQVSATTGAASLIVSCTNGSIVNIPVGSVVKTTPTGTDVVLDGTTVTNNGQVISNRDVDIQAGTLLNGAGTYVVPRDLNISACMANDVLTVNAPTAALTAGRNVNFDLNPATPGQIIVNVATISANAGLGLVQINPGASTATLTATSINGQVIDPNYLTTPSDTISVTVNSNAVPLQIGQMNATANPTSTVTATNNAIGGTISTVGNITGNDVVTLQSTNITNNNNVIAVTGNVLAEGVGPAYALNITTATGSNLTATAGNVNLNGTALGTAGAITVTGNGNITANNGTGMVNLNIGANTANVAVNTILGDVQDPNYLGTPSGSVTVTTAMDATGGKPLTVGNFNATANGAAAFSSTNTAGDVTTFANITASATAALTGGTSVTIATGNTVTGGTGLNITAPTANINGTGIASTNDVVVQNPGAGTLTVNMTAGNLTASKGNVDFNGTALGNAGSVLVTGTGNITADGTTGTNGLVSLNIGGGTATVSAKTILGGVQDPNYATTPSGSVTITTALDATGGKPLTVGNFNTTVNGAAAFSATNTAGDVTTFGNITASATADLTGGKTVTIATGNTVTGGTGLNITAPTANINGTGIASTNDVVLQNPGAGTLKVNMTAGNLTASKGDVDFNGTALANAGSVLVTGTGAITADGTTGTNGLVNLNIGTGTANVTATSISGTVQDPNANFIIPQSGSVTIQDSSAVTLQVGNFASTTTVSAKNTGNGAGTGDVQVDGNILGTNSVTLTASGTNGNVSEGASLGVVSTGPAGIVTMSANGPIGVGFCMNPILLNTPAATANAPNGSVAYNDQAAVTVTGTNAVNATNGEYFITDTAASASAIAFAPLATLSAEKLILYAPNGGLNLTNGTITITNAGSAELVANNSILSVPASITGFASTIVLASTTGSIGTATTPISFNASNFSASAPAPGQSVYVEDTNVGNTTIINPNNDPCAPTITGPNAAGVNYFVQATNANGTALLTGTGVTVTAPTVAAISTAGALGASGNPFSTDTATLTANAGGGVVNVSNNNAAAGVTLAPNTVFGNTYGNTATSTYTFAETGTGAVTNNDNVSGGQGVSISIPGVLNNNDSITATTGNVLIQGTGAGKALTINTATGSTLTASAGNINLNGTALGTAGAITVTGTGNISADGTTGTNGLVNLNIGTGTANVTATSISGTVQDPNANFATPQSGGVTIQDSSAVTLQVGNFASITSVSATNTGNGAGTGDVQVDGNILGANSVTLTAPGTNGNVSEGASLGVVSTGPAGIVTMSANGPIGVGFCMNPILLNTPAATADAPHGSVAYNDQAAVTVTGTNTVNTTNGEYFITDTAASASAIAFAPTATLSAEKLILYAPNGGLNLANGTITITNAGSAELVANDSILSVPASITGFASTLILASTTGSIGTATTPISFNAANFSASAPAAGQSVNVQDVYAGNVTIINPDSDPCAPIVTGPNAAGVDYFVQTTNAPGTALLAGTGVTVTAPTVAAISTAGAVGATGNAFSTDTATLTANAGGGAVNVSNNNAAAGVTLAPNTVFGNIYSNAATSTYSFAETGTGAVTNGDTITGGQGVSISTPGVLNNNGTMAATAGDVTVSSNAALVVNTGVGSSITATNGNLNFNTVATNGSINLTGGANGDTITASKFVNFNANGGDVTTDTQQINGQATVNGVAGANVNMTTYTGNLSIAAPINTASATGNGGEVTLTAQTGSVNSSAITTNGSGAGNTAGAITINSFGNTQLGALNANGLSGAGPGLITITAPNVQAVYISATGSGLNSGGNLSLVTNNLVLTGSDATGASINVNATGTGNGGTVNLQTTSNLPFVVGGPGPASGNGIAGNIEASGVNGGFVTITANGNFTNYAEIRADGTTGNGGNILIQNSLTPGTNALVVNNYGLIHADNNADDVGLIGLNGGPNLPIYVNGTGTFWAGTCVHIGNLDQGTLAFLNPPAGNIYEDTRLTFHPQNCTRSPVIPVNPNPPKPKPPIPTPVPLPVPHHPYFPGVLPSKPSSLLVSASTPSPLLFGLIDEFGQRSSPPVISTVPTDQTQVFNITNLDNSELFFVEEQDGQKRCPLIEGSRSTAHQFQEEETGRLTREGIRIASDTQDNYFNLDRGNVVFSPTKPVVVGTHEGQVHIGPGSNVLVMETGHDVMVYNLHDDKKDSVKITSAKKEMVLEPGRMLVLTRQNVKDYDLLASNCHCIAYRNVQRTELDDSIKAFYGDFSIPSAFTIVVPLKQMLSSNDPKDKAAVNKIIKTAAMLTSFAPGGSPFQNGTPNR